MVVMDLVDGRDSYSDLRHWDLPRNLLDDIKCVLGKLHDAQLGLWGYAASEHNGSQKTKFSRR
jgi:hypothetical protein